MGLGGPCRGSGRCDRALRRRRGLGLAGDLVDVIVPCVGGVGEVTRAVSKGKKAVDAVDDVHDAAKAADNIGDAAKAAKRADGVCFVAGTLVETENGSIPIEEITAGMLVYAHNPDTGETELKEVVQTFVRETNELVHINVNGEEIITTPTHPFWVPEKGWTDAIQLRAGDRLQLLNGEYVIVEQVQHEILEAPVTVYNFEVEGFHTYYVGEQSLLVHNRCGDDLLPDDFSTGRTKPLNITEQVAMKSVKSNPSVGNVIMTNLKDPRLPIGAVKMSQQFNTFRGKIEIHYIKDVAKNIFFDFKFK